MFSYLSRSILNAFILNAGAIRSKYHTVLSNLAENETGPLESLSDCLAAGNCPFRDARHATHEFDGHILEYDRKTSFMFNSLRKKILFLLSRHQENNSI